MFRDDFNIDGLMDIFNENLRICKDNRFGVDEKGDFYLFDNATNEKIIISNFIVIPLECIHNKKSNDVIVTFIGIIRGQEISSIIEVPKESLANSKWISKLSPFCNTYSK